MIKKNERATSMIKASAGISGNLTTVMYHYVRKIKGSQYPNIKGLEERLFRSQIAYLKNHYNLISPQELRSHILNKTMLPEKACLLTFDDGYIDHYLTVFPILNASNIKALFFAPKSSLVNRVPLSVNKVQFILATSKNSEDLADELDWMLAELKLEEEITQLRKIYHISDRFDTANVLYFKRLLQHALPEKIRESLINSMFSKYVTDNDQAFCDELYLSMDQAKEMIANGMEFGGHGDKHLWHSKISDEQLHNEINGANHALDAIGMQATNRFYSYPFGDQDENTKSILMKNNYMAAFTVEPSVSCIGKIDPLLISRHDTNDIPFDTSDCDNPEISTSQDLAL